MRRFVCLVLALILASPAFAVKSCNLQLDYFVGESMVPAIHPGDKVWYRWLSSGEKPQRGDIVLVHYQDTAFNINLKYKGEEPTYLVHRLIAVKKDGYILKGDNNPKQDPVVFRKDAVRGVVCRVRHL